MVEMTATVGIWTCDHCKQLMYCRDSDGYPVDCAPLPLYLSDEYAQVCSVCYELWRTLSKIESDYWTQ